MLLVSLLAGLLLAAEPSLSPAVEEEVEVQRVLMDARVVGRGGEPVLGLSPDDFVVRVDGVRARPP